MKKILSLNVGQPRELLGLGRTFVSAIRKQAVEGPVHARRLGLDGDAQADLTVHGGPNNALCVYPSEHYAGWRAELGEDVPGGLGWGTFGENLTTTGLLETEVAIGDRFRIGSALVRVTQPRSPCAKLAARLGRPEVGKSVLSTGRTGFYLAVDEEGEVEAGDAIELVGRAADPIPIAAIISLFQKAEGQEELLRRVVKLPDLEPNWREYFERRLGE